MSKTESVHNASLETEKAESSYDTITGIEDKDEALRLVGLERTEVFSEEAYRQVRRKLVSTTLEHSADYYADDLKRTELFRPSALRSTSHNICEWAKFTSAVSVSKVSRDKNVLNYAR